MLEGDPSNLVPMRKMKVPKRRSNRLRWVCNSPICI
ncbi:hypothetical protein OKW34_003265 [Paraburkholderia youngii]